MNIFRSLACLTILLAAAASVAAQEQGEPSLGEVARRNQAAKKVAEPARVFTDQGSKEAIPAAPVSYCGDPLPIMQTTYAAAFAGQSQLQPSDEELSKALLDWLDHHPELQLVNPRELARADEPRTEKQEKSDQELAEKISGMLTQEIIDFKPTHSDEEVAERIAKALSAKAPPRQADALIRAVRDEELRRSALKGQPTEFDRVSEAINLYSICENKRLIVSQTEVEQKSIALLRKKLADAGFRLPDPNPAQASEADGK
jgi:hypothetical protein